jgi:hypothetical protein
VIGWGWNVGVRVLSEQRLIFLPRIAERVADQCFARVFPLLRVRGYSGNCPDSERCGAHAEKIPSCNAFGD